MDKLKAEVKALHNMRVALGAEKLSLVERPGGGTVINVESFIKLGDGQRQAFEEELSKLTGSSVTVVNSDAGYVSRVEMDAGFEQGVAKLAGLTAVTTGSIKLAMGKHATMQVQT